MGVKKHRTHIIIIIKTLAKGLDKKEANINHLKFRVLHLNSLCFALQGHSFSSSSSNEKYILINHSKPHLRRHDFNPSAILEAKSFQLCIKNPANFNKGLFEITKYPNISRAMSFDLPNSIKSTSTNTSVFFLNRSYKV